MLKSRKSSVTLPPGFVVVDLETTTQEDGGIRACDGRKIHLAGMQEKSLQYIDDHVIVLDRLRVLIGHNIKFDLEHLRRDGRQVSVKADVGETPHYVDALDQLLKKGAVLDTQYITYLHSGHTELFPSLERACEYWGVPIRKTINLSEELPKVNWDISKIPSLAEYLFNDLEMTSMLIMKQLEDPWVKANFPWILQMHQGLMGTFEIEYNGMYVDPSRLAQLTVETNLKLHNVEVNIRAEAASVSGYVDCRALFEVASNDHIAALLFGGTVMFEERVPNGVYASGAKAGLPKYKIERHPIVFPKLFAPLVEWKSAKTGKYSVSDDVLNTLVQTDLIKDIKTFRELSKLYGTYLDGLRKHIRTLDGKYYVFPQINLCQTATGRTSSSKPNMQNNPTHDSVGVASIYTSRYGKDGILLEVDFKQVEILALALLSNDNLLRDDIISGRDIHTETGRLVFGAHMTKEQRRTVKTINFGLIYGGGAETLAKQAGVAKELANRLIKAFYKRYVKVKEYFDNFKVKVQALIDTTGKHTGKVLENGAMQKICIWESITGRRYAFKDYYSEYHKTVEVSHTETRNYPIQGLATGDLVLSALGVIWRKVLPKYVDDVKLVGLVHDSLRFDLKFDRLEELLVDLKYYLENSGNMLNAVCKAEWDLPVKVSFSKGTDFFNMNEFEYP